MSHIFQKLFIFYIYIQVYLLRKVFSVVSTSLNETNQAQHNPNFSKDRNVIVHLFEWKFNDIANECEKFLGPKGFGGVQLSPINEHVIIKNENITRPWWERYQPISYKIQSRSGDEEQFLEMSKRCNKAGIRLYVDVILNHMAGPNNYFPDIELIGTDDSTANASELDYPAVPYTREHFHKRCIIEDYTDGHEVRNCMIGTLPDLDQSQEYVKSKIIDYLDHLVDLGVAGFRVDSAKHIWPIDLENIYSRVKNLSVNFGFDEGTRPFFYQEVIDLGGEAISKTEYSGFGIVTEFLYSIEIGAVFNRKALLNSLKNWGSAMGFLPSKDVLVFIDSHNNQRDYRLGGDIILTYKTPKKYIMAISFMLAHSYGIPRIMSSYAFNDPDQGPPTIEDDENDAIKSPSFDKNGQCNNDEWICEHRWNAISNMIEFRNNMDKDKNSRIKWFETDLNQIAFCKENKGFIAFNNDDDKDYSTSINLKGFLSSGVYCDIISGKRKKKSTQSEEFECTGTEILIDKNGIMNFTIPFNSEFGVIAIHDLSKIK